MAGEHGIPIADDRRRKPVQPDDAVKEGTCHHSRCIGVAECNEVRIFGEAIDHREDDRFATDLWQAFNEVHRNICPHLGQNSEGLQ